MNRDIFRDKMIKNSVGDYAKLIDNDTYYLSGKPALMILITHGAGKELDFMTNINGTVYFITYITSIANYPRYINDVNIMTETFHVLNKIA